MSFLELELYTSKEMKQHPGIQKSGFRFIFQKWKLKKGSQIAVDILVFDFFKKTPPGLRNFIVNLSSFRIEDYTYLDI